MVIFFAPQVRDANTGELIAGLVGQSVTIVYPGTSDPVEITEYPSDVAIPGSVLTVGDTFSLTSFNAPEGVYAVEALASNGARAYLESAQGSRVAAEAAALSAAEAADSAAVAAQAAQDAASGGGGGSGSGVLVFPVGTDTSDLPIGTVFGLYTPTVAPEMPSARGYKVYSDGSEFANTVTIDPSTPTAGQAPQPGDLVVAIVATSTPDVSGDISHPAGWTQIRSDYSVPVGTLQVFIYVKVWTALDSTFSVSLGVGRQSTGLLRWYKDASDDIDDLIIGAGKARGEPPAQSTTITCPSIVTTSGGVLVEAFAFERTSAPEAGVTWANASEEVFVPQDGDTIQTIAVASQVLEDAGTSNTAVCTYPNPQSANGWGFQLGIPTSGAGA